MKRPATVPEDWAHLPPGDATLTRRVKLAGPSLAVVEKRGRKTFSKGIWAPEVNIRRAQAALAAERARPEYAKRLAADRARRARAEASYVVAFEEAVMAFLRFAPRWTALARVMAKLVAVHATPVGSGTVARTKRISIAERAEAAVIAWMRHKTSQYDAMKIERGRGKRRAVRRAIARASRALIEQHRREDIHEPSTCALCIAARATPTSSRLSA